MIEKLKSPVSVGTICLIAGISIGYKLHSQPPKLAVESRNLDSQISSQKTEQTSRTDKSDTTTSENKQKITQREEKKPDGTVIKETITESSLANSQNLSLGITNTLSTEAVEAHQIEHSTVSISQTFSHGIGLSYKLPSPKEILSFNKTGLGVSYQKFVDVPLIGTTSLQGQLFQDLSVIVTVSKVF